MSGPPDDVDREARDRSWRSRPHRRLPGPARAGLGRDLVGTFGEPISVTISPDPPELADLVPRDTETCPICGGSTAGTDRFGASIHPRWANGLTLGIGVWAHRYCFDLCPESDEPAPIPW